MDEFVSLYQGNLMAGVDEVGRGPIAGPVVAAAVILDPFKPVAGVGDSKKLSEKKRERLFDEIREQAIAWSIAFVSVEDIDRLNILHASMLAMKQAVEQLNPAPEHVLVDGNRLPEWRFSAEAVVKGDGRVSCIGAASILAKVARDREMCRLAELYPEYGLEKHKGYPTKSHLEAIEAYGVNHLYRRSFAPVARIIGA